MLVALAQFSDFLNPFAFLIKLHINGNVFAGRLELFLQDQAASHKIVLAIDPFSCFIDPRPVLLSAALDESFLFHLHLQFFLPFDLHEGLPLFPNLGQKLVADHFLGGMGDHVFCLVHLLLQTVDASP